MKSYVPATGWLPRPRALPGGDERGIRRNFFSGASFFAAAANWVPGVWPAARAPPPPVSNMSAIPLTPIGNSGLTLSIYIHVGVGGFFPSTGYVRNCSLVGPPQGADGERLRVRSRKSVPGGPCGTPPGLTNSPPHGWVVPRDVTPPRIAFGPHIAAFRGIRSAESKIGPRRPMWDPARGQ